MTAKQYLRQIQRLNNNIRILETEIVERRERLTSIQSPALKEKVQSSSKGDQFAEAIAILADKDKQLEILIIQYENMRDKIVSEIMSLENETQRAVLYEHYVRSRNLYQISEDLAYSYYRICHIHGDALVSFTKKYLISNS